nr:uncharacterized protein LOC107437637 [Parasteatoda tepidariorum]
MLTRHFISFVAHIFNYSGLDHDINIDVAHTDEEEIVATEDDIERGLGSKEGKSPDSVENLRLEYLERSNKVLLLWNTPKYLGAGGFYKIYYKVSGSSKPKWIYMGKTRESWYICKDAQPGVEFKLRVKTKNDFGASKPIDTKTFRVKEVNIETKSCQCLETSPEPDSDVASQPESDQKSSDERAGSESTASEEASLSKSSESQQSNDVNEPKKSSSRNSAESEQSLSQNSAESEQSLSQISAESEQSHSQISAESEQSLSQISDTQSSLSQSSESKSLQPQSSSEKLSHPGSSSKSKSSHPGSSSKSKSSRLQSSSESKSSHAESSSKSKSPHPRISSESKSAHAGSSSESKSSHPQSSSESKSLLSQISGESQQSSSQNSAESHQSHSRNSDHESSSAQNSDESEKTSESNESEELPQRNFAKGIIRGKALSGKALKKIEDALEDRLDKSGDHSGETRSHQLSKSKKKAIPNQNTNYRRKTVIGDATNKAVPGAIYGSNEKIVNRRYLEKDLVLQNNSYLNIYEDGEDISIPLGKGNDSTTSNIPSKSTNNGYEYLEDYMVLDSNYNSHLQTHENNENVSVQLHESNRPNTFENLSNYITSTRLYGINNPKSQNISNYTSTFKADEDTEKSLFQLLESSHPKIPNNHFPGPPRNLEIVKAKLKNSSGCPEYVFLNWNPPEDSEGLNVTHYVVETNKDSDLKWNPIGKTKAANTMIRIKNCGLCSIRIRAITETGKGIPSSVINFTKEIYYNYSCNNTDDFGLRQKRQAKSSTIPRGKNSKESHETNSNQLDNILDSIKNCHRGKLMTLNSLDASNAKAISIEILERASVCIEEHAPTEPVTYSDKSFKDFLKKFILQIRTFSLRHFLSLRMNRYNQARNCLKSLNYSGIEHCYDLLNNYTMCTRNHSSNTSVHNEMITCLWKPLNSCSKKAIEILLRTMITAVNGVHTLGPYAD